MPKFSQDQISQRQQVSGQQGEHVRPDVVAAPVDTFVNPAENNLLRLSNSLGIFTGAASKAINVKERVDFKTDLTVGQATRLRNDPMPQEASPAVQQGYRQMHGEMMGIESESEMTQWIAENKFKPDFQANYQQLMSQKAASHLQGVNDPVMMKALMPHLMQAEASGLKQVQQVMTAQQRAEINSSNQIATSTLFSGDTTPETLIAGLEKVKSDFTGQDITKAEIDKNFAQALSNHIDKGNPQAYDVVNQKLANGSTFAQANPEIAAGLAHKRDQAIEKIKSANREASSVEVLNNTAAFEKVVKESPLSIQPGTEVEYVMKNYMGNSRAFNSLEQAQGAVKRLIDARMSALVDQGNLAVAEAAGSSYPLDSKGTAAFEVKYVKPLWVQGALKGDYAGILRETTKLHDRFGGYFDKRSASFIQDSIQSAVLDDKGLPQVTKSFGVVYDHYNALVKEHRQDLLDNQFDTKGKQMMERIQSLMTVGNMPATDALNVYRQNQNNHDKAKVALQDFDRDKVLKFKKDLHSDLNPWGPTGEPINKDVMVGEAVNITRQLVEMGVPVDDAQKYAKEHVKESFVRVGDQSLLASPSVLKKYDMDQASFIKGAEGMVTQYAKEKGVETKDITFSETKDGQSYLVYQNGYHLVGHVGMDTIKTKANEANVQSLERLTTNQGLADEIRIANTFSKTKTVGGPTIDQMVRLGPQADAAYKAGTLRPEEYADFKRYRDEAITKAKTDAVAHATELSKGVLGGLLRQGQVNLPPDNFVPPRNPGGNNLSSANYARSAAMQGDLTTSLIATQEGLVTKWTPDNKGNIIGYGFNDKGRSPAQIESYFKAAGVPDSDIQNVRNGLVQMTPAQAQRLLQVTIQKEYLPTIYKSIPKAEFDAMPKNAQAVITSLAYNTGDPAKFPKALESLRNGDHETAKGQLMVKYEQDGKMVDNTRLFSLYQRMLSGESTWNNYLGSMIQRQGNK